MIDLFLGLTIVFGIITVFSFCVGIRAYQTSKITSKQLKNVEEKITLPQEIEELERQKHELEEDIKKDKQTKIIQKWIDIHDTIARMNKEREQILLENPSFLYLTTEEVRKPLEIRKKESMLIIYTSIIVSIITTMIMIALISL